MKLLIVADNWHPFDSISGPRNWWLDAVRRSGLSDFDQISTSDLLNRSSLEEYDVLIIPSDQTTNSYNKLVGSHEKLGDFVADGGVVSYGVAGWGWRGGQPPSDINIGGTYTSVNQDFEYDVLIDPNSELGSYTDIRSLTASVATHASLGARTDDPSNVLEVPVTLEDGGFAKVRYEVGDGDLIITGLTLESPNNPNEWQDFYPDYLEYLESLASENANNETTPAEIFNSIQGTNNDDHIIGTVEDDLIIGKRGSDLLTGGSGNDTVKGGNGRDVIGGSLGSDYIYGGFGQNTFLDERDGSVDHLYFKSDQFAENWIYGKAGNNPSGTKLDLINGLDQSDRLFVQGVQTSELTFTEVDMDGFGRIIGPVSGIGIYANGFLEGLYTGGDLSGAQLQSMTVGVDA